MSPRNTAVALLVTRMLEVSQQNVETLVGAFQRVARELSSLSFNYNGHMVRAGLRSEQMQALDAQLEDAATVLGQTLFDLRQRLLEDVAALRALEQTLEDRAAENTRVNVRLLRERLDAYDEALESEYSSMSETLSTLSSRLRLMANNIEIAACHAGGDSVTAPVDLFCIMSSQLRALADRLRTATGDLRIFQQTQNGNVESMRLALAGGEEDAA